MAGDFCIKSVFVLNDTSALIAYFLPEAVRLCSLQGKQQKNLSLITFFLVIADCKAGCSRTENNCVKAVITRSWFQAYICMDPQMEKDYIVYCCVVNVVSMKQVGGF